MTKELRNPSKRDRGGAAFKPGRCLVLAPRDAAVSGVLLTALGRRGLEVHLVSDEPGVMVELAEADCAVVVAVDPSAWPRLGDLAYAIRQHYPSVRCWQFGEGAEGEYHLSGLQDQYLGPRPPRSSNAMDQKNAAGADADPRHSPCYGEGQEADSSRGPVGRIVGRRRIVEDLAVKAQHGPSATSAMVTSEELTMLLGPTPGEAS